MSLSNKLKIGSLILITVILERYWTRNHVSKNYQTSSINPISPR